MENRKCFTPAEVWRDNDGKPIQAHGGGILFDNGIYYWFGENKDTVTINNRTDIIGISCYSSEDLLNWKNEGIVLPAVADDPGHDLYPDKVLERPKVLFNEKTNKYVMWAHLDSADYSYAGIAVAVSDHVTGPYSYIGKIRPNEADSRDMTLFKDDDGKAYVVYSSEMNSCVKIALLTDDFMGTEGTFTTHFKKPHNHESREAPAVFKSKGKYYLITSGCTGWDCNEAEYAVANTILGPWTVMGNPCAGKGADKTFHAQSTFVIPVQGKQDAFIFMADRWYKDNLGDSRYIWLPIRWNGKDISIHWLGSWDLTVFD